MSTTPAVVDFDDINIGRCGTCADITIGVCRACERHVCVACTDSGRHACLSPAGTQDNLTNGTESARDALEK